MKIENTSNILVAITTFASISLIPNLAFAGNFRSINGSGNNIANPTWGEANTQLLRLANPAYEDGLSVPRGGFNPILPSARAISNAVSAQSGLVPNSAHASDWIWQWGQFLDHDLDLTPGTDPAESFNVLVPQGDPFFDPFNTGTQEIGLNRSVYINDSNGVRQQLNQITSFIDGSSVYGSDATRAADLRLGGMGLLRTSAANNSEVLLPLNVNLLDNANDTGIFSDEELFIAGDVRANEQVGLMAAHTLFVREHNRLATEIKQRLDANDSTLVAKRDAAITEVGNGIDDEDDFIYESTRKVVGAKIQKITYEEYLPILLGQNTLTPFSGYDDTVNAGISNEFSTAAFRVGHTQLSPDLLLVDDDGNQSSVSLRDSFFNPDFVKDNGIDSLLLGLASQKAQEVDTLVIDDVRNFLFGPPGAGGFDLVSLNIQRGRDHGLTSYNQTRQALGLGAISTFLELTGGDADLAAKFASIYDSIDDVDLWIGGLAESHINGGLVGQTFSSIISDQFLRLRDGDRFFYLNDLEHINILDPNFGKTSLSGIIRGNSSITNIQNNAFIVSKDVPEPASLLSLLGFLAIMGLSRRKNYANSCK